MNTGSTFWTAVLRGAYWAVGSGSFSFLTAWQLTNNLRDAAILGGLAALTALGFRGGAEGIVDAKRQENGDIKSSDVQPIGSGKAV